MTPPEVNNFRKTIDNRDNPMNSEISGNLFSYIVYTTYLPIPGDYWINLGQLMDWYLSYVSLEFENDLNIGPNY